VTGESHLLSHCDARIIGNHVNSSLTPAVISVELPVFDLGYFVEFLAELKGRRKRTLS
jgi:hypothetical protein